MNQDVKITELEAKVAELTALVERLAAAPQGAPATAVVRPAAAPIEAAAREVPEHTRSSRRGMLKLAGAAAVGAAAAAATNAMPAAAASGDNLRIGLANSATTGDLTSLVGTMSALADSSTAADIITGYTGTLTGWDTSNSTSGIRAGVMGYSGPFLFGGGNSAHGVFGVVRATGATGAGVYARSEATGAGVSPGLRARSNAGPALLLEPVAAGAPTTGTWARGAIQPDTAGNLWYCVTAGTPGTWRKLTGANAAGAFHAITPGRVYDSRLPAPSPGTIGGGATRTISVADRRDTGNGSVVEANFVPAGAIAVTANVTVTETTGSGFLAVNPGGNTTVNASTINWSATGQILANGVTLTLNGARELTVISGGGGSTHFIVDISGYYL